MKKRKYSILAYIVSLTASVVGIMLNFFLARTLEANAYGNLQFAVSLSTLIAQVLLFGLNTFLIREAKNEKAGKDLVNKCFSLYLMIALFFLPAVSFILENYVSEAATSRVLTISILIVAFLMGANSLISAYWQGNGKYYLSLFFENLLPKATIFLLGIVFFLFGKMPFFQEKYLIIYILIYSAIAIPVFCKMLRGFSLSFQAKDILTLGFFFGVTITYNLGNELTKVLQGQLFHNAVALATISVSTSMLNLVVIFTNVLLNMSKPIFSKMAREQNEEGLLDIYRFTTRANSYIAIPFYLFFGLFSQRFLSIFGESYTQYPMILVIMSVSSAVNSITGPNGTMLAMTGHERFELANGIGYFIAYAACAFLFSFDSVYGLSWALLVANVLVNVAKYIECFAIHKRNPLDWKTILSLLMIAGINALVICPLLLIRNFYIWLISGIVVGALLILGNFFLFSLFRKTDFRKLVNLKV